MNRKKLFRRLVVIFAISIITPVLVIRIAIEIKIVNLPSRQETLELARQINPEPIAIENVPFHVQAAFAAVVDEQYFEREKCTISGMISNFVKPAYIEYFREEKLLNYQPWLHERYRLSNLVAQMILYRWFEKGSSKRGNNISRILQETLFQIKLERIFSKQQLLELYLNTLHFGKPSVGIKSAAQHYFNKAPSALTLEEAAGLAGILRNVDSYNPFTNCPKFLDRQEKVLAEMVREQYIAQSELDNAVIFRLWKCSPLEETAQGASKSSIYPATTTDQAITLFVNTDFDEFDIFETLPRQLQEFILAKTGPIAPVGGIWNSTDCVMNAGPFTRLIRTGSNGNLHFIWYENGGIGYNKQFVLFEINQANIRIILGAVVFEPETVDQLKQQLGDETAYVNTDQLQNDRYW